MAQHTRPVLLPARLILLLLTVLVLLPIDRLEAAIQAGGDVRRVSVDSFGVEGNGRSEAPAISADGRYVAFRSDASNLVANDLNDTTDIFVHDRQTGQTTRVSKASDGLQGNGPSTAPVISADGRFVAFQSEAENLVSDDTNDLPDVFVHDRLSGETSRVSVSSNAVQANGTSSEAAISGDGRFVAFTSDADNLVLEDENGFNDVFLHDRQNGTTIRVSRGLGGAEANRWSHRPATAGDGRAIAFISQADNLTPGDTNGKPDVFVFNRQTGAIERVSLSDSGLQAAGPSYSASISADGRYVAFDASLGGLVAGDTNDVVDIFVRDRQAATTVRVSISNAGVEGNDDSFAPRISAGGRYVAFWSNADTLVPGDTNGFTDAFLADLATARVSRINISAAGEEAGEGGYSPAVSADGGVVAYTSFSNDLVAGDKNNTWDIFAIETLMSVSGRVTALGTNAPVAGVTISAGPGLSTQTDVDGFYKVADLLPGAYTLTATAPGKGFMPPSHDILLPPTPGDKDFGAYEVTTYSISGTISDQAGGQGIQGVIVSDGAGRTAETDANGDYVLTFVTPGDYTLSPSKSGYDFTPQSRAVSVIDANIADQDFSGRTTYSILGHVFRQGSGLPLAGVTIVAGPGLVAVSDVDGIFLLTDLPSGTYPLTAEKDGYTFSPAVREVTVPPDAAAQDFIASPEGYRVYLAVTVR